MDYKRLEWQNTLKELDKSLDVAYQDVLSEFDLVWCIWKSLLLGVV
jgi:hypothetical protein